MQALRFKAFYATVVVLGCFAVGCGSESKKREDVMIGGDRKSDSIKVKRGNSITVKLPIMLATGFIWSVAKPDAHYSVKEEAVEEEKSPEGKPREFQVFRVTFLESGKAILDFDYFRDKGTPSSKHYQVQFQIE